MCSPEAQSQILNFNFELERRLSTFYRFTNFPPQLTGSSQKFRKRDEMSTPVLLGLALCLFTAVNSDASRASPRAKAMASLDARFAAFYGVTPDRLRVNCSIDEVANSNATQCRLAISDPFIGPGGCAWTGTRCMFAYDTDPFSTIPGEEDVAAFCYFAPLVDPRRGSCAANLRGYHTFSSQDGACREIPSYGGCGNSTNLFRSVEECEVSARTYCSGLLRGEDDQGPAPELEVV